MPLEQGVVEAPSDPKTVFGTYQRWQTFLTLNPDGSYTAETFGCFGRTGDAAGTWSLEGSLITLAQSRWSGIAQIRIGELEIMSFEGRRLFLPTDPLSHQAYKEIGIDACFQKLLEK